jgi:transposase
MPREKKLAVSGDRRRRHTDEFKSEAVQMLLDCHTAASVKDRLGLPNTNMLYRWKQEFLTHSGPVVSSLEARVKDLESELRRVERERDVLRKRWPFSAATSERRVHGR